MLQEQSFRLLHIIATLLIARDDEKFQDEWLAAHKPVQALSSLDKLIAFELFSPDTIQSGK